MCGPRSCGHRNLSLVLLSWIVPVALLIVAGFLLSLPFTGWAICGQQSMPPHFYCLRLAALVILINTAFQTVRWQTKWRPSCASVPAWRVSVAAPGGNRHLRPQLARWRLWLDNGSHHRRLLPGGGQLLCTGLCLGGQPQIRLARWYSACQYRNRLRHLGRADGIVLALLDPARISVANQVARLDSGKQTAEKFDFDYLKFEGRRYGVAALEQLKTSTQGKDAALVREKATQSLAKKNKWEEQKSGPLATICSPV